MIYAVHYTNEGMVIKILYVKPQLRKSERTQGLPFPISTSMLQRKIYPRDFERM